MFEKNYHAPFGANPLAKGDFHAMNPSPTICTKQDLKQEFSRLTPELRSLEARLFDSVWDYLRFNHLTPAVVGDEVYLVRDKDGYGRKSSLREILNLCMRWNLLAQGKETGSIRLMRLEEEETEFQIISECIRDGENRHSSIYEMSSLSDGSVSNTLSVHFGKETRPSIDLFCIPQVTAEEENILDELDISS